MATLVTYDTETTGLPEWKKPSDDEAQPHTVQIGAIKHNLDTGEEIDQLNIIVKPDGWEIPQETIDIHGITNERALAEGIPEKDAIQKLVEFCEGSERNAFNRTFDQRIIRIGLKRFFNEETQEAWANKEDHHCTMLLAKPIMQLSPKGRYGYKQPKLSEAYRYFTGENLEGAHDALIDAKAAAVVYLKIKEIDADVA
ncbi:3'-5' exonuclease [Pseudoalteromonas sp. S16_S37]|uniref:3'-5' exonuclease n=1 Tax=Pseudoalteromonas sp. S16_S37 TaxID=2720228 RepID=UPI00168105BA|nr:3'-5' exonuclease [Pseudoalteromonas sp. S16_S37]MBD1583460.1 3'-5' exonuclease [Pseudoalteromonas sp. S16_S37]